MAPEPESVHNAVGTNLDTEQTHPFPAPDFAKVPPEKQCRAERQGRRIETNGQSVSSGGKKLAPMAFFPYIGPNFDPNIAI
jgi:hypothetical protein